MSSSPQKTRPGATLTCSSMTNGSIRGSYQMLSFSCSSLLTPPCFCHPALLYVNRETTSCAFCSLQNCCNANQKPSCSSVLFCAAVKTKRLPSSIPRFSSGALSSPPDSGLFSVVFLRANWYVPVAGTSPVKNNFCPWITSSIRAAQFILR